LYKKLRELRHEKGYSVDRICKTIGVETVPTYYKKETGSLRFSLSEAKKIADLFHMKIEDIFFEEELSEMEQLEGSK
jgi:putative transcriptional regulator